jgi:hypothetical protein
MAQKAVRVGENAIRKAAHHSPENQIIRDSAGELVSKKVGAVDRKVAEKGVAKDDNPHVPYSTAFCGTIQAASYGQRLNVQIT